MMYWESFPIYSKQRLFQGTGTLPKIIRKIPDLFDFVKLVSLIFFTSSDLLSHVINAVMQHTKSQDTNDITQHLHFDGTWSQWGVWSQCSVTCGDGFEIRSRVCLDEIHIKNHGKCLGSSTEQRECVTSSCNHGW